ncbi:MAG TPA: sulfatase-like hydrolase/transferase, partial [Pirellulales bacterium]
VGGKTPGTNHPRRRGFDRAYGTAGGGSFFDLKPLYLDDQPVEPEPGFYATDVFTDYAVKFLAEHGRRVGDQPFFLNLCYTAPHFPLHAKPDDIAKYRGKYNQGWDKVRERRFARQQELRFFPPGTKLSPRDPVSKAWDDLTAAEREEYAQRMAVHAAMVDCMDQGIGRVLVEIERQGATENTLVLFLSDNGASAEALDSWPNPARGHKPGSVIGTAESHRCLEVGWATAANTPFRMHKMWIHEGGISTPLIAAWPKGIAARGELTKQVGHVIDLTPTFLELAGVAYPQKFAGRELRPLDGQSLVPVLQGAAPVERTLGWEHEGNRGLRAGDWKVVASYGGEWELYNLAKDRTETVDLAAQEPDRLRQLTDQWQAWGDKVGVAPWKDLPGANYKPSAGYRKKSESVAP